MFLKNKCILKQISFRTLDTSRNVILITKLHTVTVYHTFEFIDITDDLKETVYSILTVFVVFISKMNMSQIKSNVTTTHRSF